MDQLIRDYEEKFGALIRRWFMTGQLENIEKKVLLLVEELNKLRQQNAALSDENKKLKAETADSESRIGELTQRLSNTQQALAGQRGDDSESSQNLRKQIDQYISEIDKCIAWLQNAWVNSITNIKYKLKTRLNLSLNFEFELSTDGG